MRAAVNNCAVEQKYCCRDSDDCTHYTPCHSTGDAHRRKIDGLVLVIARGPDRLIISADTAVALAEMRVGSAEDLYGGARAESVRRSHGVNVFLSGLDLVLECAFPFVFLS